MSSPSRRLLISSIHCIFERPKQHQASIPQHDRHTKHTRRCLSSRGLPSKFTRKELISQTAPFNNSIGLTEMLKASSPIQTINSYFSTKKPHSPRKMIPRKAALHLTPKARETFRKLIAATKSEGIMLKYEISSQHALRMAFKFDLIKDAKKELTADDEGVSLEVLEDGITPKPPAESWNDNLPKLYIHHGAFMKVLGGTLDVELNSETGELKPKLFDRNGYEMDPNA
eukprot:CCRYP_004350-RA/>CCRYP_004350-RA protein AED:0.02 eAED:0.02 QI:145/1/1/1/0.5/0.33/3/3209/227